MYYQCFKSAHREKGASSQFLFNYNWVYTSFWFFLFHQHVRHLIILKSYRYLSAYNEYCQVNVEGAYINNENDNREPGNGYRELVPWFLVSYISKRLGYFEPIKSETGIGEPGTSSLFLF